MYAPPPRDFLYLAYRLDVEFSDGLGTTKQGNGTGFMLAADNVPILVTNRHVVDLDYSSKTAKYKDFRLSRLVLNGRSSTDERYAIDLDVSTPFAFPEAREDDVACLINFSGRVPQGFSLYHHAGLDSLATQAEFDGLIWPGDQVYFAGYPSVHDKLDHRPILRAGIIASDPRYNYSVSGQFEGNRVAYEAMSTPGASGSPVYAPARGISGIHAHVRRDILVGINAGHVDTGPGSHSGMSFFVKATVLRRLLNSAGIKVDA
jgi:hypothetical protein